MLRVENLAMLNRLGQLVWEAGGLPILVSLIEEGNIDRQLVASVLRTSGSRRVESRRARLGASTRRIHGHNS